jgi:cytochrome c
VLPKYAGNKEQLVAFIRNPVKVDPAYPPMPNPGLKPNEADAVAAYLLERFEELKQK